MTKPHVAAEFLSAPGWNHLYSEIGMNTKNVSELLQSLDSSLSRVEGAVNSLKERLIHLENAQGLLVQKMTHLNAARAQRQSLVVALGKRLDRAELCLKRT